MTVPKTTPREGYWMFHLHRWSRWMNETVSTTVRRANPDGSDTEWLDHLETRKYAVCELCGAERRG